MSTEINPATYLERASAGGDALVQNKPRLSRMTVCASAFTVLLFVLASVMIPRLRPSQRFNYDESDYMYAVSKGFLANYCDTPSLSPVMFVKKGLQALRPANWAQLSEFVRESDDIALYRHYHGPLHFYSILLVKALVGNVSERSFRLVTFVALLLCAFVAFVGSVFLDRQYGAITGCLCVLFLLTSPNNIQTAMWLTPHTLYAATALGALFMMARLVQTSNPRYLCIATILIAISFTAIEYAILLIVTLFLVLFIYRRSLLPGLIGNRNPYTIALKCLGLFVATIAVLWPGGIFKLTLVKDYLFFLYFSTVRSAAAYGTDSLAKVWYARVQHSPLEAAVLLALTVLFLWKLLHKRHERYLVPFALYVALVALTVFRNRSSSPSYISSLLPPLYFIVADLATGVLRSRRRIGTVLVVVIAAALLTNGYFYAYRPLSRPQPASPADGVVQVLSNTRQGGSVLVPHDYLPTAHYYFPSDKLISYPDDVTERQLSTNGAVSQVEGILYIGKDYQSLQQRVAQTSGRTILFTHADGQDPVVAYIALGASQEMPCKACGNKQVNSRD